MAYRRSLLVVPHSRPEAATLMLHALRREQDPEDPDAGTARDIRVWNAALDAAESAVEDAYDRGYADGYADGWDEPAD